MRNIFIIIAIVASSVYSIADDSDAVYDPIRTPIYCGKILFCSKIVDDVDKTPCDIESRLVLYSKNTEDTIRGVMQFWISFDIKNAEVNKELVVLEIADLRFIRCDKSNFNMNILLPEFYEELHSWHWWLGEYMNPLTLYPQQLWTIKYIVIPQ